MALSPFIVRLSSGCSVSVKPVIDASVASRVESTDSGSFPPPPEGPFYKIDPLLDRSHNMWVKSVTPDDMMECDDRKLELLCTGYSTRRERAGLGHRKP